MILRITLMCIFLFIRYWAHAQNWVNTGSQLNAETHFFYVDTSSNELYVTGNFTQQDSNLTYGIAKWDGSSWSPALGPTGNSSVQQLIKFQGNFYVTGTATGDLYKWDGTNWQIAGSTNGTGTVWGLYNDGDSVLYVLGAFDSINGIAASYVARYTGTVWEDVDSIKWSGGAFVSAHRFQGEMYFCGAAYNSTQGLYKLVRWNGQIWNSVGNTNLNGSYWINRLCVYNNELFVGGYYDLPSGNPGNYVARWDGSTWTQVGGGMFGGQVWGFKEFNGELWVTGQFTQAGGITAMYISRYDGIDWCSVGVFNIPILPIEVYNNELYVGGNWFLTVDGDTMGAVAKWVGGSFSDTCGHLNTGLSSLATDSLVLLCPNPSNRVAIFQFNHGGGNRTIIMNDQLGREIWRKKTTDSIVEFPASEFPAGMYFYTILENESHIANGKFLIEL